MSRASVLRIKTRVCVLNMVQVCRPCLHLIANIVRVNPRDPQLHHEYHFEDVGKFISTICTVFIHTRSYSIKFDVCYWTCGFFLGDE